MTPLTVFDDVSAVCPDGGSRESVRGAARTCVRTVRSTMGRCAPRRCLYVYRVRVRAPCVVCTRTVCARARVRVPFYRLAATRKHDENRDYEILFCLFFFFLIHYFFLMLSATVSVYRFFFFFCTPIFTRGAVGTGSTADVADGGAAGDIIITRLPATGTPKKKKKNTDKY